MNTLEIFAVQFLLSLVVVGLLAKWFVHPWLERQEPSDALIWLTVPHAFRHLGLVFLVPGVVAPSMAESFSVSAAYGDLGAGLIAILALVALRYRWAIAIRVVWALGIVGTLDLANALSHVEAVPNLQAAWYVPTFVVPVLLVTHFMLFARLLRLEGKALTRTGRALFR